MGLYRRLTAWTEEIYSSTSFVGSGLQLGPAALVLSALQYAFPERFPKPEAKPSPEDGMDDRKPVERLESCELAMQDAYYEQMILDVNDDIYIIIRNLNPGVSLDEISFDQIACWVLDNPTISGHLEKAVRDELGMKHEGGENWA